MDMPPICIWLVTFHFSPSMPWASASEVPAQVSSSNAHTFFMEFPALLGFCAGSHAAPVWSMSRHGS